MDSTILLLHPKNIHICQRTVVSHNYLYFLIIIPCKFLSSDEALPKVDFRIVRADVYPCKCQKYPSYSVNKLLFFVIYILIPKYK
jgi:hypothetical protein